MQLAFWKKKKNKIDMIKDKIETLKVSLFVEQLKLTYYTDLQKLEKKFNV